MRYELTLDYWDERYEKEFSQNGPASREKRGPYAPPVYPNGWFKGAGGGVFFFCFLHPPLHNNNNNNNTRPVADSREVPIGSLKNVHFWGKDLVVFRGQNGQVGVLDAYCPHLGAHLGIGGVVKGNCLSCPFHGWEFDSTGKCQKIPYTDGEIPANASTRSYTIDETHNVILLWYDAEGRDPTWRLRDAWPSIPENWTYEGKAIHHIGCHIRWVKIYIYIYICVFFSSSFSCHKISTHLPPFFSEVPENGADVAHLNILHEPVHPVARWLSSLFAIKHRWTASWEPSPENPAFTVMALTERVLVSKSEHSLSAAANDSDIRQVGPGIVILKLRNVFGEIVLLQSLTPQEPFHQRLETMMFSSPSWGNFHAIMKLFLLGYSEQVERDVLIWNKKRYSQRPVLVKGDGPIAKFRRWYSQFYSENSPTWESITDEKKKNKMDW